MAVGSRGAGSRRRPGRGPSRPGPGVSPERYPRELSRRMPGASARCTATCGSGTRTGTGRATTRRVGSVAHGRRAARAFASSEEAAGSARPSRVAPRGVTGGRRDSGITLWASVPPGACRDDGHAHPRHRPPPPSRLRRLASRSSLAGRVCVVSPSAGVRAGDSGDLPGVPLGALAIFAAVALVEAGCCVTGSLRWSPPSRPGSGR